MFQCLAKPLIPQYKGGIVVNPELNEGLKGWTTFGDAKVHHVESDDGNSYIVASARNRSYRSFSQQFDLDKDKLYTLSGTPILPFHHKIYAQNIFNPVIDELIYACD